MSSFQLGRQRAHPQLSFQGRVAGLQSFLLDGQRGQELETGLLLESQARRGSHRPCDTQGWGLCVKTQQGEMGWRLGPGELKRNRKKPRKGEGSVAEEGKSHQLSDPVSSNQTGETVFRILRVDRADTPTYLSRGGLYSSKVRFPHGMT